MISFTFCCLPINYATVFNGTATTATSAMTKVRRSTSVIFGDILKLPSTMIPCEVPS